MLEFDDVKLLAAQALARQPFYRTLGITVPIVLAYTWQESGVAGGERGGSRWTWDEYAVGDGGKSFGLGQIQLASAQEVGFAGSFGELMHPETNLHYSLAYLAKQVRRFGLRNGLAAYNAGPGNVARGRARNGPTYVEPVLRRAAVFHDLVYGGAVPFPTPTPPAPPAPPAAVAGFPRWLGIVFLAGILRRVLRRGRSQ